MRSYNNNEAARSEHAQQAPQNYYRDLDGFAEENSRNELTEAPQSLLAHFSVLPEKHMEPAAHPAWYPCPNHATSICLRGLCQDRLIRIRTQQ
jgi:hypothetical protein